LFAPTVVPVKLLEVEFEVVVGLGVVKVGFLRSLSFEGAGFAFATEGVGFAPEVERVVLLNGAGGFVPVVTGFVVEAEVGFAKGFAVEDKGGRGERDGAGFLTGDLTEKEEWEKVR
jgi:hypothetical protein